MGDCLRVGGALKCALAGSLPPLNRRLEATCLCIVHRDELRTGLRFAGELIDHHPRDAFVILLSRAFEQRLVGGLLNQYMLEDVGRLRWSATLIQELRLDQTGELVL